MERAQVKELAKLLRLKKDSNNRTVLFLGAKAGRLFRNKDLYQLVLSLSTQISTFENLNEVENFHECYRVLAKQNEQTVHDILGMALKNAAYRREDIYLVNLVKEKYFDLIISTNIDNFVESAFNREDLREPHDYEVFLPEIHSIRDAMQQSAEYCLLIKAFGDFSSRRYTTPMRKFNLHRDREFKEFLERTLAKNVLVVGFDPIWDWPLELAFPEQEGDYLWYVNEEMPAENSIFARAIESRGGNCLIESYERFIETLHLELLQKELRGKYLLGSYDYFIQALHLETLNREPSSYVILRNIYNQLQESLNTIQIPPDLQAQTSQEQSESMPTSTIPTEIPQSASALTQQHRVKGSTPPFTKQEKEKRKRIFISYSHKDAKFLERLQKHLASYERNGLVDIWHDQKIAAGANWLEEIKKALEDAKVAVLLVSADFLASKFIAENELPPLLAAAERGGARIIPVIVSPCVFDDTPLYKFQAINDASKPLTRMGLNEKEETWVKVAKLIKDA